MVDFFAKKLLPLPTEYGKPSTPDAAGQGRVTLPEGEAVLLLRDPSGKSFRLSWDAAEEGDVESDRVRALPAGTYALLTERFVMHSQDGTRWHSSSTKAHGRTLVVEADKELVLEPKTAIRVTRGIGRDMVSMNIQSESGAGLSIYKDGIRIPIRFTMTDSAGEVQHRGKMNYG
ncbi:MAG: hypothetical protein ACI841_004836 [Planctomycetota bacterium]